MKKSKAWVVALAVLMVGSGCASEQRLQQNGPTALTWVDVELRFMRDTPTPIPRECPISMLEKVKYLDEKKWAWYRADKWFSKDTPDQFFLSCPDKRLDPKNEIHLSTWDPIGLQWSPSAFRVVAPGVISSMGFVAAAGTLGATMPKPITNVNQTTNAFPGSRFSTGYFNATPAPAWLGQ